MEEVAELLRQAEAFRQRWPASARAGAAVLVLPAKNDAAIAAPALVPTSEAGKRAPYACNCVSRPACHQQRLPPPAKARVWTCEKFRACMGFD